MYTRNQTRVISIGDVKIGGGNPIAIQSMTNTKTEDVEATVKQILALEKAGCQIIRCTVPTMKAAEAFTEIKKEIHIPLVADIHFDYKLAIAAMEHGADKIRINPGNIGCEENIRKVVETAKKYHVPIRVGVNNEANSELIWTLPYIVNENVTPGTSPNFFAYYLAPNGDRTRLREAGYTEDEVPAGSHAQYVVPTQAYCDFLAEDARDTRTDVSVRVFEDKFLTEEVQIKRMVVKFKGSFANDTRSFDSDVPVYRLAEAYLLKAEVENALGNTDAALQNLNVVAKRAYGVDNYYTARTQDAIDNAIISEILKEFVAESKAWWAYLRFNKEFELIETLKGREGEKNVTLWPIAPACLNTNPNITQTEGYK